MKRKENIKTKKIQWRIYLMEKKIKNSKNLNVGIFISKNRNLKKNSMIEFIFNWIENG